MTPHSARLGAFVARTTVATLLATASQTAFAAFIDKADNTDNLNLGSSWIDGVVPGSNDIVSWFQLAGANSVLLGGDLSFNGLVIGQTGGPVTIGGANLLTIGTAGIDMNAASQNLTIDSNLAITPGSQTWN
ncbi:MAG: hypothetical protein EOP83_17630, partial [Verrucomicrobiaceae bacterium]